MSDNWLLALNEINVNDLRLVGRKALSLATLNRNGLTIPPGLVVSSAFFEAQVKHFSYGPLWAGSPDVAVTESSLEFLADFLKTTPLSARLDAALKEKLLECFPPEIKSFAVRSSAIDEDQKDHSFAGTYLTELDVPRDLLTVSLTRCWASALAGKAIQYRLRHGMSIQSIQIAVLIQPMLKPEASGVGFTLNPINGARDEMVIEAASGLGEVVVGGGITPYRYHISRQPPNYPVLKKLPGDTVNLMREPLSDQQLTELAKTLEQAEAMMGRPQDVEWAYSNSTLYLLQTRPITAIPDAQPSFFNTEWTRANHLETLPEIPSPLFMSLMTRTQSRGYAFFTGMGLDVSGLGPYMQDIYGRPFLNLSIIKRVFIQMGFNPMPLLSLAGYTESNPATSNPFRVDGRIFWQARASHLRLIGKAFRLDRIIKEYRATVGQVSANLAEVAATSADRLGQFRLREKVYGGLISAGLVSVSTLTGLMVTIARLIGPLANSPDVILQSLGKIGANSIAANHGATLLNLGRLAAKEPILLQYLVDTGNGFEDYRQALANTEFLTCLDAYLAEYGKRGIYEPDMAYPRFEEQIPDILKAAGQYARVAHDSESIDSQARRIRTVTQIWRQLTGSARGLNRWLPWRKALGWPLVFVLRHVFRLREALFTAEARGMAAVRKWDLTLAKQWVTAGLLERVDDYFWLTMEEIERAIVAEDDGGVFLKPAVTARKETYRTYTEIKVPVTLKASGIPRLLLGDDFSQEVLSGTLMGLPVSPGQVQGVIKILEETDSLDQVPEGSILVAPSTDPALLPFFPLAAGLIVEVGGMLSHGSIIAREYGVPAVSNITDARTRLKSGDRVLLDGSTGVIQILEAA